MDLACEKCGTSEGTCMKMLATSQYVWCPSCDGGATPNCVESVGQHWWLEHGWWPSNYNGSTLDLFLGEASVGFRCLNSTIVAIDLDQEAMTLENDSGARFILRRNIYAKWFWSSIIY